MHTGAIPLEQALDSSRTGDLWLFRGHSVADHAIQLATNSPINHVAVAIVVEDLPPLLWHAELGRKLLDVWAVDHHRGAQLHRLDAAVHRWHDEFGQKVWLRQLQPPLDARATARALAVVDTMNGAAFPTTRGLAWRWVQGRAHHRASLEFAYCAEVVATALVAAGVLEGDRPSNWYDPGRFWSGDRLRTRPAYAYDGEVEVTVGGEQPPPRRSIGERMLQRWT